MKDIYAVGKAFTATLQDIVEFLTQKPFADFVQEFEIEGIFGDVLNQPLIFYLIGGGLVGFLIWKIVCFIIPS